MLRLMSLDELSIVTERGNVVPKATADFVDKMLAIEKKSGQWAVIAVLYKFWALKNPDLARSYGSPAENFKYRGLMKNKHASTRVGGAEFRKIHDAPMSFMDMIARFYPSAPNGMRQWGPYDQMTELRFHREFPERFPMFKVPEKI